MLIGKRMTHPVITVSPEMAILDALEVMKKEHIRRLPVVKDGKLVGIVADKDIMNASPSGATSLSVWEVNYLVSKIKVKDIMMTEVQTVSENDSIEKAARLLADQKIGGLPVTRDNVVVGIITETDLFRIFSEMMGTREKGIRVTALVAKRSGMLADLTNAISAAGGSFISFNTFAGESINDRLVTFKISDISLTKVREIISPMVMEIEDMRESLED